MVINHLENGMILQVGSFNWFFVFSPLRSVNGWIELEFALRFGGLVPVSLVALFKGKMVRTPSNEGPYLFNPTIYPLYKVYMGLIIKGSPLFSL